MVLLTIRPAEALEVAPRRLQADPGDNRTGVP